MSVSALTSVAGLTLSAGLLVAVPGAQAAASTCRGLPVTIEGASNSSITGTPGDDVILAPFGSYGDLDAGAGDDVVCVVPGAVVSGYPDVQYIATGGPGDDVIDSTALSANQYGLRVYASAGSDTFVGGAAPEFAFIEIVYNVRVVPDTEPDVFSMGAGRDEVMSGEPGVPNGDVINMGPGEDIVVFAGSGMSPGGLVDGGEGRDLLSPTDFDGVDYQTDPLPPGDAVFDARTGDATVGGVPYLSWAGIESYGFGYVRNRVTFRGSNGPEWLSLRNSSEQDVDMGGGHDVVVEGYAKFPPGVVRGGDGRDRIRLDLEGRASLDLRGSAVMVDEDGIRHEAAVDGFEDAQLQASVVKLPRDLRRQCPRCGVLPPW